MGIKTVAVFNASSRQGLAQLRQLVASGYAPVAVTRQKAVIEAAGLGNIAVRAADNADPASLDAALAGVDAVFFQVPLLDHPDRLALYAENVAAAASRAGVQRFVHNSTMWSPDDRCGEPTYDNVRRLEKIVEGHGLPLVIYRPTVFMDNWLTAYALPLLQSARLYRYPHKPGMRFAPLSLDDLAKFMVAALERDGLLGRRLRLAGPEILTPEDVRATLSDVIGTEIRYEYQSPADFARYTYDAFVHRTGADRDAYVTGFDLFYTFNNDGAEEPFRFDIHPLLKEVPVELETFRQWAARQDWNATAGSVGSPTA